MTMALLTDAFIQAIGWTLVHLVWQGMLVATLLAVLLALLPGRSGNLRYGLSCLALALVVVLGVATGVRSYRVATPAPMGGASDRLATYVAEPTARLAAAALPATATSLETNRLQAFAQTASAALPSIVVIWLAGVVLFSARLILEWLRVRRLLTHDASEAPEPWPSVARRLSRALGVHHVVRVLESTAVEVPSVIGLVRPAILIPASTLTGLSPAQLEMILAHELAHIRRHDFLVNLLQAIVETLLFYHPAIWWISRQIRIERENCCDDLAVATCGNRLEYARALLQLDELRAERPALAMSARGGSLFERIRRISQRPMSTAGPAARAMGALVVQLCVLAAIAAPSISGIGRSAGERAREGSTASVSSPTVAAARAESDHAIDAPTSAASTSPEPSEPAVEVSDLPDPDAEYAPDVAENVEPERPSLDDIIMLRVHGVTADEIDELRSLLPSLSLRDIAGMKAVGATPDFIREMRSAGLAVRSAQEAQGLAALGVTRAFVREMRSVGFPLLSAQEAQGLKAVGVTGAFVREMRSLGLSVSPQEAQGLAALGATPEYVEEMRDAGVDIEDAKDVQSLRALGITSEFVRRLAKAGYRNLSVEDLSRLGASGVTGDFVREMSRYRSR